MLKFQNEFQGTSCKFSYLNNNIIACGTSEFYGIIGRGKLSLFYFDNYKLNYIKNFKNFYTENSIFDIEFNKINQNLIFIALGNGILNIYNLNNLNLNSLKKYKLHNCEIFSINFNHKFNNILASSSTDKTLKLTDINYGKIINNFIFNNIIYSNCWHNNFNNLIACSFSKECKIFDIKIQKEIFNFNNKNFEIMTCDFNKFNDYYFLFGTSNGIIYLYDIRNINKPVFIYKNHKLNVKKIICSPFEKNIFLSCSYDMNINLWDINNSNPLKIFKHHTEFVNDINFNIFNKNIICSTSFDNSLCIFNI